MQKPNRVKPRSANLRKLKTTSLIFLFSFALRGLKNIPTHRTHSHKKMKLDRRVKVEIWHGFFCAKYYLDTVANFIKKIG